MNTTALPFDDNSRFGFGRSGAARTTEFLRSGYGMGAGRSDEFTSDKFRDDRELRREYFRQGMAQGHKAETIVLAIIGVTAAWPVAIAALDLARFLGF